MRRKLIAFHLWLGITIGLLWALQGLGGALLTFHRDMQRLEGPAVSTGPMASLDRIADEAGRVSQRPIERIGVTDEHGDILVAEYRDQDGVRRAKLVDAARGETVGDRELEPGSPFGSNFWGWLYHFHESLGGGRALELTVGVSGVFLVTALVAGLWVGWPRRGAWRAAFAMARWRTRDQKLYGWHRALGLAAGLPLLIAASTGIYLIFAPNLRPLIAQVVPHIPPYSVDPAAVSAGSDDIGPQAAYDRAQALFPAAAFVSVTMPTTRSPAYTVRLRQSEELRRWSGVTSVTIDKSGRVLARYDAVNAPLSNRIGDAIFAIHSGEVSGTVGRLLLLLLGLALPTLYAMGIWAWLRRAKRRRAKRQPKTAAMRGDNQ